MKRVISVAAASTLLLLLLAFTIFVLGDRKTFVPPPESVAEDLIRQLAAGRARQTRRLVSQAVRPALAPSRLAGWFEELELRIGEIQMIRGLGSLIEDDKAQATVDVQGRSHEVSLVFGLQREYGLWVVTDLPRPPF